MHKRISPCTAFSLKCHSPSISTSTRLISSAKRGLLVVFYRPYASTTHLSPSSCHTNPGVLSDLVLQKFCELTAQCFSHFICALWMLQARSSQAPTLASVWSEQRDELTEAQRLHPVLLCLCVSVQWWRRIRGRSWRLSATLPATHLDSSTKPTHESTSLGRPSTSPIIPAFASSP